MESEFPSNSSKPSKRGAEAPAGKDEKKIEKVVTTRVQRRKKPFHRRVIDKFTGGEDAATVAEYVFFEILVEAGKDLFLDALNAGFERKFYGEVQSRGRRGYSRGRSSGTRTDYRGISSGSVLRNEPRDRPGPSRGRRSALDIDDIVLGSRVEANAVIDQMFELLSRYEIVTVADLLDLVGEPTTFQDNKFGWDDLRGSDISRVRDGYLLSFPRPVPID